jgi:hypothetical protein
VVDSEEYGVLKRKAWQMEGCKEKLFLRRLFVTNFNFAIFAEQNNLLK